MKIHTFFKALFLVLLVPPRVSAAEPLAPEPRLARQLGRLSNERIQIGHALLTLEQGEASPLVAGNRVVGLYFKGKGTFEFTSDLPMERAVLQHNLAKNGQVKAEETPKGLRIQDRIKSVSIIMAGQASPSFKADAIDGESPLSFEFGLLKEKLLRRGPSHVAQALAHQSLRGDGKVLAEWVVRGEGEDWYYRFDGFHSLQEELVLEGVRGSVPLSRLPIGWNAKDPLGPEFTLTHVDLSLNFDKSLQGELTAKEVLMPVEAGLKAVRLGLRSLDQYPTPVPGNWQVRSVLDGQGRSLAFDHRGGRILVALAEPTKANTPVQLTFRILNPEVSQYTLSDYWEFGVWEWFPMPVLAGQFYTVKAFMRVPDPYLPFMGGTTVRRDHKDGFNELEISINRPVQFFTMHAGNYRVIEQKDGDLLVRVCSSRNLGGQEERLARITLQMIRGYETFLGPFPFREFTIIQRPTWGHGQAPPGLMMITSEAFNAIGSTLSMAYSKGINHRVAHEIAHQYWGHVVKMASHDDQWITESFAEYSSALMMLKTKGYGEGAYQKMVEDWARKATESTSTSSIATANQLRNLGLPNDAAMHRTQLIYDKGAFLLYRLHKDMGDPAFFTFFRAMPSNFNFKFATTLDVIDVLKAITKKDPTPFFDDYYWGTGLPKR